MINISEIAQQAATAAKALLKLSAEQKSDILKEMAERLVEQTPAILAANEIDVEQAKANKLSEAMIDRLQLTSARINDMAAGLDQVANLPEVVGRERLIGHRPNGLEILKKTIPLGVIGMIYEARPNVTADAAGLCFKSGNAVILRGGKECLNSSLAIAAVLQQVLADHNLPQAAISVVPVADREIVSEMLTLNNWIDLIIPRGGEGLIKYVTENSQIPVIQHFKGVCHLYVDQSADLDKALDILINGKTQRPGVCNALEGLLVHRSIAAEFLPIAAKALFDRNVKINGCAQTQQLVKNASLLSEAEYGEEYLSLEIAVRVVEDIDQAMVHISEFGSHHTEVICTEDQNNAELFQHMVDASVVMVNASSRFSDGSELGLGAEIGIATTKLHAYGPMGIESLTTEKFLVNGNGQVRG
ncbi:glutamate-5-semialdehyde dehydrogenase [Thalassotalea sp. PS06]|uniref:glutamate-5-semialdehyde dehydrogenase n=1 Tax=Thalassotalea sp. PS06 TaxID=2594005 RepID=UPI001161CC6D|nr:glutamate-5-semialdehyde dehydrogenase [Thalassotalea sp. PS06]QDP02356.1 glutamate-5-semialdehyde dehydrogenase [Thalassotalea sp. PS06]